MTRLRALSAAFALAALSFAGVSCRDAIAPAPAAPPRSHDALLGLPLGGGDGLGRAVDTVVTSLQRLVPLPGDISRSATVGPEGGTIRIPETGFRLDIPRYALGEPTVITVTAVSGSAVAYEFEPHGITFDRPLVISQDLGVSGIVSDLFGRRFRGAYFRSRDELRADGTALVHEIEPTLLDLLSTSVRFPVSHFSGYIVGVD